MVIVFEKVLSGVARGDGFKRPLVEREIGERQVDAVALRGGDVGGEIELGVVAHVGQAENAGGPDSDDCGSISFHGFTSKTRIVKESLRISASRRSSGPALVGPRAMNPNGASRT